MSPASEIWTLGNIPSNKVASGLLDALWRTLCFGKKDLFGPLNQQDIKSTVLGMPCCLTDALSVNATIDEMQRLDGAMSTAANTSKPLADIDERIGLSTLAAMFCRISSLLIYSHALMHLQYYKRWREQSQPYSGES